MAGDWMFPYVTDADCLVIIGAGAVIFLTCAAVIFGELIFEIVLTMIMLVADLVGSVIDYVADKIDNVAEAIDSRL
jgi:hypothetical protein